MKKITLIAHADRKKTLLKEIQNIGAIEVVATRLEEINSAQVSRSLGSLEAKLADILQALELIRRYDDSKTSFLTPKPLISISELMSGSEKFSDADEIINKTKQFSDDINALKIKKQRLKNKIAQLAPYEKFDVPLERMNTGLYTTCLLGTIPSENLEKFQQIVKDYGESAYFETIDEHKDFLVLYTIMLNQIHGKLTSELKYIGLSEAYTKNLYGTPNDNILKYQNEYQLLEKETKEFEAAAKKFVDDKLILKTYEDYLVNVIERERCIEKLGETSMTFMLEGWIVADDQDKIEKALLSAAPESYIAFREPKADEIPPTAMKNSKLVEPFEAITEMYSLPSSKGFDPSVIMSVFYFLLFGMMVGDFAYGIILTIGAYVVLKLKKPTGMFRKVTTIVMTCGISTALWGLFFGTIFSIEGIPAVINPINDAMTLLVLCLAIGILHIMVGLGIGAYICIKRGHFWEAVFDKISWIAVLIGGILLALGGTVGTIGTYMAIVGIAVLFFTQGRSKKGIFRKFIGGFAGVYGVTGYISDILSYCRLFGMGLATSVISMVFNTIASLFFGNVIGYIVSAVILTVGHVFNISINTLGAFVHTARLQFIEFYSRFYEGGGRAFSPLDIKAKNFRLEER
ncbi:MAG: V-type ATP synthase subunit I [Christensenellales bacterium]